MNTLREKVSATRQDLSIFVARKIDELEMKLLFVGNYWILVREESVKKGTHGNLKWVTKVFCLVFVAMWLVKKTRTTPLTNQKLLLLSSFVMIGSCDYVVIILDLVVRYSTKNLSINIEGTGMAADVEIKTNFELFFFLLSLRWSAI